MTEFMAGFSSAARHVESPGTNLKPVGIEAGLLPAFRGLVVYWMLYWLLISPAVWFLTGSSGVLTPWQYAVLIAVQGVALVLLVWEPARRTLGGIFLPLVLTLTTLTFFIEKSWFLTLGTAPDASQGELLHVFAVRQDFVLLLLIIAWQYRYRWAVLYVAAISAGEWLLVLRAEMPDHLGSTLNANMLLTRAVVYLLLGYIITWLMRRQRQQRRSLVQANSALGRHASAVEQLTLSRERNRLARELHDTLAHSLSAVSVQLEATSSLWDSDPDAARQMLDQAAGTTRNGLTEARRSLQALRASPLDEVGLAEALRDLAERAAERADLELDLVLAPWPNLSPANEQAIYRIAQEALENVVRHADATRLTVRLEHHDDRLHLDIEDDGTGFDPDGVTDDMHFGLAGMRERAAMLAGSLKVSSRRDRGTRVTLELSR